MPVRRNLLVLAAIGVGLLLAADASAGAAPKLTAKPGAVTTARTATFKWTTGRGTRRTLCRVTRRNVVPRFKRCSSPTSWAGLAPGHYRFMLIAQGSNGRTRLSYSWQVVTPVSSAPGGPPPPPGSPPPPPGSPPPPPGSPPPPPGSPPPPPGHPPPPPPPPGPPPPPPPTATNCGVPPYKYLDPQHPEINSEEQKFVDLVNQARQGLGLQPLAINSKLDLAADSHSYWQDVAFGATGLSHTGCGGTDPWTRLADAGYSGSYLGEVTLVNSAGASGATAFTMFKGSPPHWALLTSPNFTQIGVGQSRWHWTGDLGAP